MCIILGKDEKFEFRLHIEVLCVLGSKKTQVNTYSPFKSVYFLSQLSNTGRLSLMFVSVLVLLILIVVYLSVSS